MRQNIKLLFKLLGIKESDLSVKLNTVFWALLLYLELFVSYKVMYKDEENYSSTPLVLTLYVISLS